MKLLLLTPPMVQVNTPYPATAYLTGFLRGRHKAWLQVEQRDPAIELVLKIFSAPGLTKLAEAAAKIPAAKRGEATAFFLAHKEECLRTVPAAVRFLQGKDPSLAVRIASRRLLPEGPRFRPLAETEALDLAFGALGVQDQAKHIASLFLDDIADAVREAADPLFEFSRYGERLAASQADFAPLLAEIQRPATMVDGLLEEIVAGYLQATEPDLVGLSVPFSGTVYAAFRIAKTIRRLRPKTKILLGGGYVNTELRELADPRVFDYFDFITLDDGERPFECLLEHLKGERPKNKLLRTFTRENGKVVFHSDSAEKDVPFREIGTPTYDGLPLGDYLAMLEMLNPMHRLWSDYRWNKLTLAHGCYWNKCSFCDTSLDYIRRYETDDVELILARMESLMKETGQTGFHFVDEAAPPALLRALSKKIIERGWNVSWWGNIRFEKAFTPELTKLMADAGCIAVTGGLEVATDRVLKLIKKGVTVEQVARAAHAFQAAGIFVHAYLMYGFPTQSEQETVDSLEVVRQLFQEGCLHSAFWHRFAATAHSPVGRAPEQFGIKLVPDPEEGLAPRFAKNDLAFLDPTGADHDTLGVGLRRALYNYMLGVGLDEDVRGWFSLRVPKTKVPKTMIRSAIRHAPR